MRVAILTAAVTLTVFVTGCSLVTTPVNYVTGLFKPNTTTLEFTVNDDQEQVPIVGATLEFFALQTGEDPRYDDSFERIADAVIVSGDSGIALATVEPSPNEPGDHVVRLETMYRVVATAAGYEDLSTSMAPYNENSGVSKKALLLKRK
jgi:hypothetical protein